MDGEEGLPRKRREAFFHLLGSCCNLGLHSLSLPSQTHTHTRTHPHGMSHPNMRMLAERVCAAGTSNTAVANASRPILSLLLDHQQCAHARALQHVAAQPQASVLGLRNPAQTQDGVPCCLQTRHRPKMGCLVACKRGPASLTIPRHGGHAARGVSSCSMLPASRHES